MDSTAVIAAIMTIAFIVNIIVQVTKDLIPIPSQLLTIIVSVFVTGVSVFAADARGLAQINALTICEALSAAFVVAYIAMYGFDTFRDLWDRFKTGKNINKE